jgi:predicted nucleic acid-binding protein
MASVPGVLYWDASALLSALFSDRHSKIAKKWADTEGVHFVSSLSYAEVCAVIARLRRERILTKTLITAAYEILDNGPWRRIFTRPDWVLMRTLSEKWSLRGADLWHLCLAKSLMDEFPELKLLSFDKRLNFAAKGEALGFE